MGENTIQPETNFVCGDFVTRRGLCTECKGLKEVFKPVQRVWTTCKKCEGTGRAKCTESETRKEQVQRKYGNTKGIKNTGRAK
jgi:DnaJ-class molecular chaperone